MVTWNFKGILVLCLGPERRLAKPLSAPSWRFYGPYKSPPSCFTHYPGDG